MQNFLETKQGPSFYSRPERTTRTWRLDLGSRRHSSARQDRLVHAALVVSLAPPTNEPNLVIATVFVFLVRAALQLCVHAPMPTAARGRRSTEVVRLQDGIHQAQQITHLQLKNVRRKL